MQNNVLFLIAVAIKKKQPEWIDKTIYEMEIIRRDVYYEGKLHKRQ